MGCFHSAVRGSDDGVDGVGPGVQPTNGSRSDFRHHDKVEETVALPSDPLSQQTGSFHSAGPGPGPPPIASSAHHTAPQVVLPGDLSSDSLAKRVLVGSLANVRSSAPTCLAPEDAAVQWLARSASKDHSIARRPSLAALQAPNESRSSSQFPLVPCARSNSIDRRMSSIELSPRARLVDDSGCMTPGGTICVKETDRMVVDQVKDHVFINQYLIIKDLGKGAYGTVKLVYNTEDDMLYAMKVVTQKSWPSRVNSCQPLPQVLMGPSGHPPSRHPSARSGPLTNLTGLLNSGPRTPSARSMAVQGQRDSDGSTAGGSATMVMGQHIHHQHGVLVHGSSYGGGASVFAQQTQGVSLVGDGGMPHMARRLGDSGGGGGHASSSSAGTPPLTHSYSMNHASSMGNMSSALGTGGSGQGSRPSTGPPVPVRSRSGKSLLSRTTSRLAITQSVAGVPDGSIPQQDSESRRDSMDRAPGASVVPGIAPVAEESGAPSSLERVTMAGAEESGAPSSLERVTLAGAEESGAPSSLERVTLAGAEGCGAEPSTSTATAAGPGPPSFAAGLQAAKPDSAAASTATQSVLPQSNTDGSSGFQGLVAAGGGPSSFDELGEGQQQAGDSGMLVRTRLQLPGGSEAFARVGRASQDVSPGNSRSQLRLTTSVGSSDGIGAAPNSAGPHPPVRHGTSASGVAAPAGAPGSAPLAAIVSTRPMLLARAAGVGSSRFGADQTNPALLGSSSSIYAQAPGSDSPMHSPAGLRAMSHQPGPAPVVAPVSSRLSSYNGAAGGNTTMNSFNGMLSRQQTGAFAQLGAHYCSEIAVMKDLDHPNVVKLYEVISSQADRKVLMIMEYVEGGCVMPGGHPTAKDPISEAVALGYFRDVVQGLDYLHFNGVVHGDIKPDNLLLTISAKVKISDFGSARLCEPDEMLVKSVGTPAFMAPEMCAGQPFNGFKGDIWALGVCLYMFIFGSPPFVGQSSYQVYEAVQKQPLTFPTPAIGKNVPDASAEVKHLISRLLEKDQARRATLEEVATHPWVTRAGTLPLLTCKDLAVSRVLDLAARRRSADMARSGSGRTRRTSGGEASAAAAAAAVADADSPGTSGQVAGGGSGSSMGPGVRFGALPAPSAAPGSPKGSKGQQPAAYDDDEGFAVMRSAKSTSALTLKSRNRNLAPPQLGFGAKKANGVPASVMAAYTSSSRGGSNAPDGDDGEAALTAELLQLLPGSQRRVYEDGQHLIKLGEPCEGLFLLLEGSCNLIRSVAQRKVVADDDFADQLDEDEDPTSLSSELKQAINGPSGNVEFSLDYLRASVQLISPAAAAHAGLAGRRPGTPVVADGAGGGMEDLLVVGYGSQGGERRPLDYGEEEEDDVGEPVGMVLGEDSIDLSIPGQQLELLAAPVRPPLQLSLTPPALVPPLTPSPLSMSPMPSFGRRSASVPLLHIPVLLSGNSNGLEPQSPTSTALLMGTGGGLRQVAHRSPASGTSGVSLSPVLPRSRYASAALPSIHDSTTLQADAAGVEALSSYVAASLKLPSVVVDSGRIQRAMVRSDSMQRRMDALVRRAKPYASTQIQAGNKMLVCHRGPGSVLGDVCLDGRRARPSATAVIAVGRVVALLIPHSLTWKRSAANPVVRAALNRSANALLVQEAMERFVECENEVHFARRVRDHAAAGLRNVLADSYPASPRYCSSNSLLQDAPDL